MWLLHGLAAIGRDSGALQCNHFVGGARRFATGTLTLDSLTDSHVMFKFLQQVCFA